MKGRNPYRKKQFPYARLRPGQAREFHLFRSVFKGFLFCLICSGPFSSLVRVSRWTPIFLDRITRQTFIQSPYGGKSILSQIFLMFANVDDIYSFCHPTNGEFLW